MLDLTQASLGGFAEIFFIFTTTERLAQQDNR